jgi:hypothetical protein
MLKGMKRRKKDKLAFYISLLSGFLLLLSGSNGAAVWEDIGYLVLEYVNVFLVKLLFFIAIIIASLGGLSVIIGGYLILKKKRTLGRLLILIAPGAGIISILFQVYLNIINPNVLFSFFMSTTTIGIILSILARYISR